MIKVSRNNIDVVVDLQTPFSTAQMMTCGSVFSISILNIGSGILEISAYFFLGGLGDDNEPLVGTALFAVLSFAFIALPGARSLAFDLF